MSSGRSFGSGRPVGERRGPEPGRREIGSVRHGQVQVWEHLRGGRRPGQVRLQHNVHSRLQARLRLRRKHLLVSALHAPHSTHSRPNLMPQLSQIDQQKPVQDGRAQLRAERQRGRGLSRRVLQSVLLHHLPRGRRLRERKRTGQVRLQDNVHDGLQSGVRFGWQDLQVSRRTRQTEIDPLLLCAPRELQPDRSLVGLLRMSAPSASEGHMFALH